MKRSFKKRTIQKTLETPWSSFFVPLFHDSGCQALWLFISFAQLSSQLETVLTHSVNIAEDRCQVKQWCRVPQLQQGTLSPSPALTKSCSSEEGMRLVQRTVGPKAREPNKDEKGLRSSSLKQKLNIPSSFR